MRFVLRSLLVLAVATASGLVLYFAVQSLPSISRSDGPTGIRIEAPGKDKLTENSGTRSDGSEKNRNKIQIRWRSLLGVVRRTLIFAAIVFAGVIAERLVFRKPPVRKNKIN